MRDSLAKSWERFGRDDPYYGVLNSPRFRAASREGPERDDFFTSGSQHVARLFATIRERLAPEFAPRRALDFGCGVGRVLLALARAVPEVVGVDISDSMLREAHRNCREAGLTNISLHSSASGLARQFDLIHSYIVFQHIPPARGMALLATLLSLLVDGGIGAIHVVYAARRPGWRTALHWARKRLPLVHPLMNLLQGRPLGSPMMEVNRYDLNAILALLQAHDCHQVVVRFSDHGGWLGAFVLFRRQRELDEQIL